MAELGWASSSSRRSRGQRSRKSSRNTRAVSTAQWHRAAPARLRGLDLLRSGIRIARASRPGGGSAATSAPVLDHYQFGGDHMAKTKGYEYYAKMTDKIHTYGDEKVIDFFVDLQVWGTPRAMLRADRWTSAAAWAMTTSSAPSPMPACRSAEAARNIRLFATEVMPPSRRSIGSRAPSPRRSPARDLLEGAPLTHPAVGLSAVQPRGAGPSAFEPAKSGDGHSGAQRLLAARPGPGSPRRPDGGAVRLPEGGAGPPASNPS